MIVDAFIDVVAWLRRWWARYHPGPPAGPAVETTLQEIVAGKFPSAKDKDGRDGVVVLVRRLRVLETFRALDGDTHVQVTDEREPVFTTEVTPVRPLPTPAVGQVIDITGFVYWDAAHVGEAWHGSPWEIHPVTAWVPSA